MEEANSSLFTVIKYSDTALPVQSVSPPPWHSIQVTATHFHTLYEKNFCSLSCSIEGVVGNCDI